MTNKITLKSIIDQLSEEGKIPVSYISFRQAYVNKKLNEDVTKYIQEVKKFTSVSYYITDKEKFIEALLNQFN